MSSRCSTPLPPMRCVCAVRNTAWWPASTASGSARLRSTTCRGPAQNPWRDMWPQRPGASSGIAQAILRRELVEIPDVSQVAGYLFNGGDESHAFRSVLAVPLLHEGKPIGAIGVLCRDATPFQRAAENAAADVREAGRDRDRKRAPVERDEGGARTADGQRRSADRDRPSPCPTPRRFSSESSTARGAS